MKWPRFSLFGEILFLRLYEGWKGEWFLLLPVLKPRADGSKSNTEFLKFWERLQWDPDCTQGISC